MNFITEIDASLLAVLSGVVMAIIQTLKPFIADKFKLLAVGIISLSLGLLLALDGVNDVAQYVIQSLIYALLIGSASSGLYSYAKNKEDKKPETPSGL